MKMIDEMTTVLGPSPLPDFVETKYIKDITNRGLSYIKAGFPVHFRESQVLARQLWQCI